MGARSLIETVSRTRSPAGTWPGKAKIMIRAWIGPECLDDSCRSVSPPSPPSPPSCSIASSRWPESYKKGREGLKKCLNGGQCNWQIVTINLLEAFCDAKSKIDEEKEGIVKKKIRISGRKFESPLPFYYLGLAYYKTGDLTKALALWNESVQACLVAPGSAESKALPYLIEILQVSRAVEHECECVRKNRRDDVSVRRCDEAEASLKDNIHAKLGELMQWRLDEEALDDHLPKLSADARIIREPVAPPEPQP